MRKKFNRRDLEIRSIYRAHNIRNFKIILIILMVALPLFTVLDYLTTAKSLGQQYVKWFMLFDIPETIYTYICFGLYMLFPKVRRKASLPLFIVLISFLVLSQVVLMSVTPKQDPTILVVLICLGIFFINLPKRYSFPYVTLMLFGMAFLIVIGRLPVRGGISALLTAAAAGIILIFIRDQIVYKTVDLNQKNRQLAQKNTIIEKTYTELKILKEKQDGDYYLTSVLLTPLSRNLAETEAYTIEIYGEQFKKFKFRDREGEIGGDLVSVRDFKLYDRPFTVVINGDAMGKSIQGAGGALVLGSVFHSRVNRTRSSSRAERIYPEQWLREAFLELQQTFESFHGSMMASIFIGLLDEQTGLLYYINAEHPYPVIVRNGEATFFAENQPIRKIGFPGNLANFIIGTKQLQPNDIIVIGSDGRDDLEILDDSIERKINSDEYQFLDIIKKTNGNITETVQSLRDLGNVIDDLSLISIRCNRFEGLSQQLPLNQTKLKIQQLMKNGSYIMAANQTKALSW